MNELTAGRPSCGSNVNCKLRGHVTFCGLRFAVFHEKPDAKGPYFLLALCKQSSVVRCRTKRKLQSTRRTGLVDRLI